MKTTKFFASALAVAALLFTSCDKMDISGGDQNTIKGKTAMLNVDLRQLSAKSRAMGTDLAITGENKINNYTLWVTDDEDKIVASAYVSDGAETKSLIIPISATNVYVIANKEDLTTLTDITSIRDYEFDYTSTTLVATNLPQTGNSGITWNLVNNTATVTIGLSYVPARVSLSGLTLFGVPSNSVDVATADETTKTAMTTAGISKIELSSVGMINAHLFSYGFINEGSSRSNYLYSGATYYSGYINDANGDLVDGGTYFPTGGVTESTNLIQSISAPITTTNFPYFYMMETAPTPEETDNRPGWTSLVIKCNVTMVGQPVTKTMFYIIPLKEDASDTSLGAKHKNHYIITANIAGTGSENPYTPETSQGRATFTIVPSEWIPVNMSDATVLP